MDMAPRICLWGLQAPCMLPPTSSWPSPLPSKHIRGIYSPVREFPRVWSSIYQSSGSFQEYVQLYTIYSEVPEATFNHIPSIRKFPRRLFYLYRTFGKLRNVYSFFMSLSGISEWSNLICIIILGTSEMIYLIDKIFSEVSDRFIQVV